MSHLRTIVLAAVAVSCTGLFAADVAPEFERDVRPLLVRLCFDCHGATTPKGDFRLDNVNADVVNGRDAETWHDVLNRINLGEMPPPKSVQPSTDERRVLVDWLTSALRRAAEAKRFANGRVLMRRLTRYEYQNTMRDLLGVDLDYTVELPPEPMSGEGFLNNGATLEMAPAQFEAYLKAARRGLSEAVVSGEMPTVHRLTVERTAVGRLPTRPVAGHAPARPEFLASLEEFPRTGSFEIRIRAGAIIPSGKDYPRLRLSLGCVPGIVHVPRKIVGEVDVMASVETPETYTFRGRLEDFPQPGDTPFGNVAFDGMIALVDFLDADGRELRDPKRTYAVPQPAPKKKKPGVGQPRATAPPLPEDAKLDIVVSSFEFEAPVIASWPPPTHTRILFDSELRGDEAAYVRLVLRQFMTRAYRRPVTGDEVEQTVRFFDAIRPAASSFEDAMRETLAAVLVSPHFLYIVEPRPAGSESDLELNDFELAARLSYFLWSSMPDDELFALAGDGRLGDPEILAGQVKRMLAGERAGEFLTRFADQWFDLGALDRVAVNPEFFPKFDSSLKLDMRDQLRAFLAEIIRNDLSCLNLLDSDWTMLNRPLAVYYGLPGPRSRRFERVALPAGHRRGGVFGQAGFLLSNSTGEESHPIKRAVWVLDRLLDSPPASPPPDVPELDAESPDLAGLSLKEQLAVHRQKEACANCHRGIDPWGIPLENFDAVGAWRTGLKPAMKRAKAKPVDASSVLPDGTEISGLDEFKRYLIEHRQQQLARAVVKRLAGYALGRSLDLGDEPMVQQLSERFANDGFRLNRLIVELVASDAFRSK